MEEPVIAKTVQISATSLYHAAVQRSGIGFGPKKCFHLDENISRNDDDDDDGDEPFVVVVVVVFVFADVVVVVVVVCVVDLLLLFAVVRNLRYTDDAKGLIRCLLADDCQ